MQHFTAIDALPVVRPQERIPEPGARISLFASESDLDPHALQLTGTAAELLAFAQGIRDAVHLVEMRQLASTMDPIPDAEPMWHERPTECPECQGSITYWHGPGMDSGWYCSACQPDVADMMLDDDDADTETVTK